MKLIRSVICITLLMQIHNTDAKLVMTYRSAGFFSNFIQVLNYLYYCDQQKTTPSIYWGSDCYYYDKQGWNSVTHNAWEYYFEPVSTASYEQGDQLYNGYYSPNGFTFFAAASPFISKEWRTVGKQIIEKYIRIKPVVQQKIDDFCNYHFAGRFAIGIHYRGTDKITDGEAKFVEMSHLVSVANRCAAQNTGTSVFYIATDQASFIDYAQRHLNGIVTYWNSYRSNDSKPIHRKPSMAQIGEEALIDAVLLSRCNLLVRTASNLSTCSLIFNPELPDVLVLGK